MIFARFNYFYGFTDEQTLNLTVSQFATKSKELGNILRWMYGGGEESDADFLGNMRRMGIPTPGKK